MSQKPKTYQKRTNSKAKKFVSKERKDRQSMYSKEWINYRFRFLHHNPNCYCCVNKSSVVDHIVAHKGNLDLFWNITNFIPLCNICHNTITAKFDKYGTHLIEDKMKWIDKNRRDNNISVKVKITKRK